MAKLSGNLLALYRARLKACTESFDKVHKAGIYLDGISTLRNTDGSTEITLVVREREHEEDKEP